MWEKKINVIRFLSICCLVISGVTKLTAQKSDWHGEATTFWSFNESKKFGRMGYASIYNEKNFWQIRYNYEAENTVSVLWGRPLIKDKKGFYFQAIPSLGMSVGQFTGFSPACQIVAEAHSINFYSSSQYSFGINHAENNFFFNWTELLYDVKKIVKVGAAFQYSKDCPAPHRGELAKANQQIDFGPMLAFDYHGIYSSAYFFNPWNQRERQFTISLTYIFK